MYFQGALRAIANNSQQWDLGRFFLSITFGYIL